MPSRAPVAQPVVTGALPIVFSRKKIDPEIGISLSPPLCSIVITGPTGSGKSGAAVAIAKRVGGEIISADSRAIYKGMNIGTAKPSKKEQQGVPHFGLDLIEPGERFTVADWKAYAEQKIKEIQGRGHIPIIVGGTGLYIDALIFNYQFNEDVQKSYADRKEMSSGFKVFGIKWGTPELRQRIKQRIEQMFCTELYDETKRLVETYGWGSQAMKSDIYEYAWAYLSGEMSLDEAKEKAFYRDWSLARRQMTWLKRNDKIVWLPLDQIQQTVLKYIEDE